MTSRHNRKDEYLHLALAALATAMSCAIFYASWPSDLTNPRHRHATEQART